MSECTHLFLCCTQLGKSIDLNKELVEALEGVLKAYKREDLSFLGCACLAEKIAKEALFRVKEGTK